MTSPHPSSRIQEAPRNRPLGGRVGLGRPRASCRLSESGAMSNTDSEGCSPHASFSLLLAPFGPRTERSTAAQVRTRPSQVGTDGRGLYVLPYLKEG